MEYFSTRDKSINVVAAQAIAQGISKEGGLFLPREIPAYSAETLASLVDRSYQERAMKILGDFLTDFTAEEIADCVHSAYNEVSFPTTEITPLVKVKNNTYSMELWHGPTCAFKDMALQILPHLLTKSIKKVADGKEVVILVATSGDTGKAALEGFRDVEGTRMIVFYPDGGVSPVQYLQMATQEGKNVDVYGVVGNFDDTQSTVKEIFIDQKFIQLLADQNMMFSSANSINWGRLLPQIVYYISAYCDLVKQGEIKQGEKINVAVPTGNFGNILAAYYAKQMGLPIAKLICASNINNVLTDFINTGVYNRNRDFVLTSSPSMDILISSNLERLLYLLHKDDQLVAQMMNDLKTKGEYKVSADVLETLQQDFFGGFMNEKETAKLISDYYTEHHYLADTHTAVAFGVLEKYQKESGDTTKTIVASTANPYKFAGHIVNALAPADGVADDFDSVSKLAEITRRPIPQQIVELQNKEKRFTAVCGREEMLDVVKKSLKL